MLDSSPSSEHKVEAAQSFSTGWSCLLRESVDGRPPPDNRGIPQRGGRKTPERAAYEKSRPFKRAAQRFRAGIEGPISVLARGRSMKRCRLHGRQCFELLVGAAVLANNLLIIAARLQAKPPRKHAA